METEPDQRKAGPGTAVSTLPQSSLMVVVVRAKTNKPLSFMVKRLLLCSQAERLWKCDVNVARHRLSLGDM